MEVWLELKQKNYELSKAEASIKLGKITKEKKPWIKIKTQKKPRNLALTKKAWKKINPEKIKTKTFKLENDKETIKKHAAKIEEILKAKVELKKPETTLKIIEHETYQLIYTEDKEINNRKPHKKPYQKPNSLDPQLARAMINLANTKEITDPFCGTGGIIIEASLMGIKAKGIDIDEESLIMAEKNAEYYKTKVKLEHTDSTKKKLKTDAIVTDMPYGKNSKKNQQIQDLIIKTLAHNTKKAVLCIPETEQVRIPPNWKVIKIFKEYIHKSLTRKILLLEVRNPRINKN